MEQYKRWNIHWHSLFGHHQPLKIFFMSVRVPARIVHLSSSSFIEQLFMIKSSMNWRFCRMAKILSHWFYDININLGLIVPHVRLQNQNNFSSFQNGFYCDGRNNSLIKLKFRVIWFVVTIELHLTRKQLKPFSVATEWIDCSQSINRCKCELIWLIL